MKPPVSLRWDSEPDFRARVAKELNLDEESDWLDLTKTKKEAVMKHYYGKDYEKHEANVEAEIHIKKMDGLAGEMKLANEKVMKNREV
jgi:hypothetical protein